MARNKSVDAIRKAKRNYERSVAKEIKRGDKAVFMHMQGVKHLSKRGCLRS